MIELAKEVFCFRRLSLAVQSLIPVTSRKPIVLQFFSFASAAAQQRSSKAEQVNKKTLQFVGWFAPLIVLAVQATETTELLLQS